MLVVLLIKLLELMVFMVDILMVKYVVYLHVNLIVKRLILLKELYQEYQVLIMVQHIVILILVHISISIDIMDHQHMKVN